MITRTRPTLVLTVAQTGASYSPQLNPSVPITLEQVVNDAESCFAEGARALHYHARNRAGFQTSDSRIYGQVRELLRERLPGVPVGFASSRKGDVETVILRTLIRLNAENPTRADSFQNLLAAELVRIGGLDAHPDSFTVFTPPEILLCGEIAHEDRAVAFETYSELTKTSWRDPELMRAYFRHLTMRTRSLGVTEEFEITTTKSFDVVERIAEDPTLGLPHVVRFILLPGFSAKFPIQKTTIEQAISRCVAIGERFGVRTHITVGAAISPRLAHPGTVRKKSEALIAGKHDLREVAECIADDPRVDSFRAGIEDTPVMFGCPLSNPELISHARETLESLGVAIELDLAEVRRRFEMEPALPLVPAA